MFIETIDALKHLLWPTRCASCDVLLSTANAILCDECQASIQAADAFAPPESIDAACALYRYEGAVQTLISRWKFHEDYGAQHALLDDLPDAVRRLTIDIPEGSYLLPIPPHPRRLRERGFDPVWTFASHLQRAFKSAQIQTFFCDDALVRTRHTPHQAALDHEARLHNLDGAFEVSPKFHAPHVVLLDDVTTTGSTACSCARTLKAAGIPWVGFIALAQTVK